jgi:hypothetical protein
LQYLHRKMKIDDLLYDRGRKRLDTHLPVLIQGLDIWIIEVMLLVSSVVLETDTTTASFEA